ncbi:MAG: hypothetical protein ACKVOE_04490 [Rickettsiales bacterium]
MKIVLLDLNATYVENTSVHILPHAYNIQAEQYRTWLTRLLSGYYVIMLTARPTRHECETLAHISKLEQWQPNEAYFNDSGLRASEFKDMMLRTLIYPKHGKHVIGGNRYIALESNAATRTMYATHGIPAYTQEQIRSDSSILEPMTLF